MKSSIVFLAILYYIFGINVVSTRSIHESDGEQHRHRRRSYYDDRYYGRIDNSRQNEELLNEITHLLQELSLYIRRPPSPPPPPQIIYIPYPVSYPVRISCSENVTKLENRFEVEDKRQIWNAEPGDNGLNMDNGNDGNRPVTFDIIEPSRPVPAMPPVQHGSSQAGITTTTPAPQIKSRVCQAAIVICCSDAEEASRKKCFSNYGCFKTYATGISCHKVIV